MNKLIDARNRLRKNSKKGFTLVELIVVIVIIAILVAALTPAILSVINRANRSADEADTRFVMMAGSVAATLKSPPGVPPVLESSSGKKDGIANQFSGASNLQSGTYTIYFDGPVAVGCTLAAPAGGNPGSRCGEAVSIGVTTGASLTAVPIKVTAVSGGTPTVVAG